VFIQNLTDVLSIQNSEVLGLESPLDSVPIQGRVRLADYDLDGYPDLFLTLRLKNSDQTI
jgi:hypothetical protein